MVPRVIVTMIEAVLPVKPPLLEVRGVLRERKRGRGNVA